MNNVGMAGAVALVGVGLITIGLGGGVNTPEAVASSPSTFGSGVETLSMGATSAVERITWYGVQHHKDDEETTGYIIFRAWSGGKMEMKMIGSDVNFDDPDCDPEDEQFCFSPWVLVTTD